MDRLPVPPVAPGPDASSAAVADDLDPALIARAAGLSRDRVEVLESVGSTNQWLLQMPWDSPAGGPRLALARRQTAGRGRRGRVWLSGGAESLTFSVALEARMPGAAARLSGLPVITGVAIAERLAQLTDGLGLKWPNDLMRHGLKVAGLLLESRLQADRVRIVAGLGLNLLPAPDRLAAVGQPAGSLFDDPARMPGRGWLAGELARLMIDAALACTESASDAGPALPRATLPQRWARFDTLAGADVAIVFDGVAVRTGVAAGVDADGALLLHSADGDHRISVGEVSLRRQTPAGAADAAPTGARPAPPAPGAAS